MSEEKKLASLEEMTLESFQNRPEQAEEAIEEYIQNLEEENQEKAQELKDMLKNIEYFQQFKTAITHTSLILFLISIKASNDVMGEKNRESLSDVENILGTIKVDLERYFREYLLFARKDDKLTYDMRMFYLNSLTGEEWVGIEYQNDEESEEKEIIKRKVKVYNSILDDFKKQYTDSKIHLK